MGENPIIAISGAVGSTHERYQRREKGTGREERFGERCPKKKSKKNILQVWLTSHGVGARPWTSVGRRSHNRAGFNWLATRALPVHKNAGNNTSDVVRLSCVTMIRTDTTLAARGRASHAPLTSDAALRTS